MTLHPSVRIKICCIMSFEEASAAIAAGASALGLVAEMPSGPGVIADEQIAEIAARVPPPIATFLLTSQTQPEAIIDHARRCATSAVQLVDRVSKDVYSALRKALPNVKIIQVLHVCDDESVAEAKRIAPLVDALLLDSGNPALAVKQLGGTGRVHNWRLSARINREAGAPVFLAGGLRPGNVVDALATVAPYAVDVCSGVRTGGALDAAKLHDFVRAVAKAAGPGFAPLPS